MGEKKELTFETGTNELQLLDFLVGDEYFGINIAKVSEIIRYIELTPMPSAPPEIEGVFMHRDKLVTVIDLHKVLNCGSDEDGNGLLIVCDFQQMSIAFHVTTVNGIQTLSWSEIEKPPSVNHHGTESVATGIAKLENRMIMILDFEKIICDLNYGLDFEVNDLDLSVISEDIDSEQQIIVVEDSLFLNKVVVDALKKSGIKNIKVFYNGLDAWDYIRQQKGTPDLKKNLAAVISDIEMPQMDGHSLTKFIKDDKELRTTPVLLFSSLIHENMRMRGESAGADAQFARSQLNELLVTLFDYLKKRKI
ncbi:MAG: chemotaxis protein [Eubacterium sp.]|jgi:two-component system chemotaxis response regulator CheV|nr:chemotaxis protein [Eubacterium sp.]